MTFDAVNSGKKKTAVELLGTQSTVILLPVNDTSGEEKACMTGNTSRTETVMLSKVVQTLVIAGSSSFKAQTKSLAGGSLPGSNWMDGHVHVEALKIACTDATLRLNSLKGFLINMTSTFMAEKGEASEGPVRLMMLIPLTPVAKPGTKRVSGF